jgi:predicted flap endonuclease-1-like 5' DNA nuclease
MVKVRRAVKVGVRIIGEYRWERANDWTQEVADADLMVVLTEPGFKVVADDLQAIKGLGPKQEEELLLRGIATFEQLVVAKPADVCRDWAGVGVKTVRDWQEAARDILETEEELNNG